MRAVSTPHGVTGVVVIEVHPEIEENRNILALADDDPFILGLVGNLKAGTPGFGARLAEYAPDRRFRGIRVGTPWCPMNLDDPQFIADLREVAHANLAVDVVKVGGGDASLLAAVCDLADRVPTLRIIVDHLPFGVEADEAKQREYHARLADVAQIPQTYVKVSNLLPRRGQPIPTDAHYYSQILDEFVTFFGTERLLYGSNWPISARVAPYPRAMTVLLDYFGQCGDQALARVFRENVFQAYMLSQEPS